MGLLQKQYHKLLDKEAILKRKVKVTEEFLLKLWVKAAGSIRLVRM